MFEVFRFLNFTDFQISTKTVEFSQLFEILNFCWVLIKSLMFSSNFAGFHLFWKTWNFLNSADFAIFQQHLQIFYLFVKFRIFFLCFLIFHVFSKTCWISHCFGSVFFIEFCWVVYIFSKLADFENYFEFCFLCWILLSFIIHIFLFFFSL